jgi:hypothetical protein
VDWLRSRGVADVKVSRRLVCIKEEEGRTHNATVRHQ